MDLKLAPCSLAHILKESGNTGPLANPTKGAHMVKDLDGLTKLTKIPCVLPNNFRELAFVKGSTKALKFLVTADRITQSKATESLSRELFKRTFNNNPGLDITTPQSWLEAGQTVGMEEKILNEIITKCDCPEYKGRLIANTNEAVGLGAFGLPSIVIHSPEGPILLFGSDRIELLAHLIGEKYVGPNPLNSQI